MKHLITAWGVVGVVLLLLRALLRLTPFALEPWLEGELTYPQMGLCALWIAFNAWAEGYRGFQKAFAPRVVGRAVHLAEHPRLLPALLAPLYAMALFGATRRRMIVSWTLVVGIVALIVFVRLLPQPWRGIVDAGVVVGLAWGTIAVVAYYLKALRGGVIDVDLALPPAGPATAESSASS